MTPLPLDSPRWASLKAHFGNAGVDAELPAVPSLIARWNRAVGSYAEEYEYQDLHESYLHQLTILDVAYAVVPHLAARLSDLDPDRRLEVLDDLATVDAVRLKPLAEVEALVRDLDQKQPMGPELHDAFIQSIRERNPRLPDDLAPAYLSAIEYARSLAGPAWGAHRSNEPGVHCIRRHVRYLRASGWSDDDISFGIEALTREVDGHSLVCMGRDEAREGLRSLKDAPPGWFARTGMGGGEEAHRLGFLALNSLGWCALSPRTADLLGEL
jgi:hypothetical protein